MGFSRAYERSGHWIIAINTAGTAGRAEITLSEQPIAELIKFIQTQGVEYNEAVSYCYEADGNLERVRQRLIWKSPPPPTWSNNIIAPSVAASILIGAWNDENENDRNIVSEIAGAPYLQFDEAVSAWTQGADPLLICAGSKRKTRDRLVAWQRLEPYLAPQQIEALLKATETVLLDPDPRFELTLENRWLANLYGKRRRFSEDLRQGLAEALVIMAVKGDKRRLCYASELPQNRVSRSIRSIFQKQSEDSFWRRIRGELTEIAEASPDVFLDELEKGLSSDSPKILELFESEGVGGECLHAHLLWALESLAWSVDYVSRVARILASLTAIDTGGLYSNRPARSLAAIFEPAQPQCTVTPEERHRLIESLAGIEPTVTVELCKQIVSNRNSGFIRLAQKPKWRRWAPVEQAQRTFDEYWVDVQVAVRQLLIMVDSYPECWQTLLASLDRLLPDVGRQILSEAEARMIAVEPQTRLALRNSLRKILHHRHTGFRRAEKSNWEEESLDRLHKIYQALVPDDLIEREAWKFDSHVEYPAAANLNWQDENAKLDADRLVVAEQLAALGIASILDRLGEFQNHYALGYALGLSSAGSDLADALFNSHAESEVVEVQDLIKGFALALFTRDQQAFFTKWVSSKGSNKLSEKGIVTLLLGLPCEPVIWDAAEQCGSECDRLYWSRLSVRFFNRPLEAEQVARKLLTVGRALDAINVLACAANINADWIPSDGIKLIVDALQAGITATNTNPECTQRLAYDVVVLLELLAKCRADDVVLTELEWAYFGVLEHQAKYEFVIHKSLITNPNLLVDLLAFCYWPQANPNDDCISNVGKHLKTVYLKTPFKSMTLFFVAVITPFKKSFKIFFQWLSAVCNTSFRLIQPLWANGLHLVFPGVQRLHGKSSEEEQRKALQAKCILNSWLPFAKISPQEMPSYEKMMGYANILGALAKERSFEAVADYQFGRALSSCPIGTDGNWPHEVVRQLIERLQSPELYNGFVVGKQNARDMITREIGEGGMQEQKLAQQYRTWQEALAIQFPKTSALVGRLAECYERDAHRADIKDRQFY